MYDLISTSQAHRDVLYDLFKNEIVPTNILVATFFEKLQNIRKSDIISFFKSKQLSLELLEECSALYIIPLVDEWEVKRIMVDNGSTINVCSKWFLSQLQENGVVIPPLEEATFKLWAYDSSSKKPLSIATILITTGVRIISAKLQVVDSKLSYNMLLGRPWIHDMEAIPSTLHGRLKFEYQRKVHTILGDHEPYALCNVANFEDMALLPPPLWDWTLGWYYTGGSYRKVGKY